MEHAHWALAMWGGVAARSALQERLALWLVCLSWCAHPNWQVYRPRSLQPLEAQDTSRLWLQRPCRPQALQNVRSLSACEGPWAWRALAEELVVSWVVSLCWHAPLPGPSASLKRKPAEEVGGAQAAVGTAAGAAANGGTRGGGAAKRCRSAQTHEAALARIADANRKLADTGRPLLSASPESTVWSPERDAFVHHCVCGTALTVNQTKGLTKHGMICKGKGLGGATGVSAIVVPAAGHGGAGGALGVFGAWLEKSG